MVTRTRRATDRQRRLSRARVCAEALALVDEEGLEALSMRRLGARLGVEAMSLYRHVHDKADLLDALHTAVLGKLRPGPAGPRGRQRRGVAPWRLMLEGLARRLRAVLLQHPNVVILFATRPVRAPEALSSVALVAQALIEAGFSREVSQKAIIVVGVFTLAQVLGEVHGGPTPELGVVERPSEREFAFGLTALLDGIALQRQPRRRR